MGGTSRAIGEGEFEVGVGEQFDADVVAVDEVVMAVAEEPEIVDRSRAEVVPVLEVVTIAPRHRSVATGKSASAVAGRDGAEQVQRDGANCTPVVENR